MRILLLTHSFNSLAQKLYTVLEDLGHDISVEFDIHDSITIEAVNLFKPEIIIAPYLRRKIPKEITLKVLCWIIHPGPPGDRGPSALDWAILNGETNWGVTIIEATDEYDAGPVWVTKSFAMREASKSSIYGREVSTAAVYCVIEALDQYETNGRINEPLNKGKFRPKMLQDDRKIFWKTDSTKTVLRKIRSADGSPGVLDDINGLPFFLHDAENAVDLSGNPGEILGVNSDAVCRATADGAVWIKHLRPPNNDEGRGIKLPAKQWLKSFGIRLTKLEQSPSPEIYFESKDGIGIFHFPFYNGAMSTDQCKKLQTEIISQKKGKENIWVLAGGPDYWSNGIHLGQIEQAESPADESMRNIEAMNDLVHTIVNCTDKFIIAAIRANAAAGGVFLALSADRIIANDSIVLNPHYRNMGNLYGSEYWTYLLPKRLSEKHSEKLMQRRLPIPAGRAKNIGLIDEVLPVNGSNSLEVIYNYALDLNQKVNFSQYSKDKAKMLDLDNEKKSLESYRTEEIEKMKLNFYGFDPSYHVSRYNFIRKRLVSWTPLYLAKHRTLEKNISSFNQTEG
ncbi:MAG TPA: enoyl-CoA hydratase-related protein [Candidatus Marinimicrobia bacterium]|jgi:putative two-component system hydrogenase maturation factor HypX/HoxX|nr:hydrogenase maturation protein [Candidatus Neomarinimicrobiota bacterium]MDP6033207.1 enoyl-CoA hydratase-related protein [Candidatus Neomarinimicrobiota bacterium]MDP7216725.1 enoyl-CoA hydratase-related protein [Candidatus Neomarinimicrobiota bacterium]MDP7565856.1 enoyl-CoA hydratase-related protein [Candidatus Neomarinimicrobiota bacterium]HJL75625.1 enoyl-CoA hydratase-related protein [Candidatus Neomarinimicrobiota bacterium]|tara:strand:- start:6219 stop:7916 length:1698 start_codon:yes stop_codon:yes gene_type:complete